MKRTTPADDPRLSNDWKTEHVRNTEQFGLSNRESFYRLADKYGCHWTTCRYWINENVRLSSIKRSKEIDVPYAQSPRIDYKRLHNRTYQHIRRRPDIYLNDCLKYIDAPLSLDEITLRLGEDSGVLMRNQTLLRIVNDYEKRHNKSLLDKTNEKRADLYRLADIERH